MQDLIRLKSIDNIIFDLGGVVLNLDYNLTIDAFKKLGGARFDELYTQANQDKIFDQFETGEINEKEFIEYLKTFLPSAINTEDIIAAWNKMLLDLPKYRIDFLNKLRKTHRIFLFSNTNETHYNAFTKQLKVKFGNENLLDEIFEQAYFSHLVGKRKPKSEAFETLINDHQLDVERTLFIDDSIQHIEGAAKLRLNVYHLVDDDIINIFE